MSRENFAFVLLYFLLGSSDASGCHHGKLNVDWMGFGCEVAELLVFT